MCRSWAGGLVAALCILVSAAVTVVVTIIIALAIAAAAATKTAAIRDGRRRRLLWLFHRLWCWLLLVLLLVLLLMLVVVRVEEGARVSLVGIKQGMIHLRRRHGGLEARLEGVDMDRPGVHRVKGRLRVGRSRSVVASCAGPSDRVRAPAKVGVHRLV